MQFTQFQFNSKTNSVDLELRTKSVTFLENVGLNLFDFELGKNLDKPLKAEVITKETYTGLHQIKNLNYTIKIVKTQLEKVGKTFANHISKLYLE